MMLKENSVVKDAPVQYDAEVAWQINDVCNFDCPYCWLQTRRKSERFTGIKDIHKVISGFERTGLVWLIHMSGGEPFLSPNYVELCKVLTKKHYISINTNLCHKDIARFANEIDPEKVDFLHCSLHLAQRERTNSIDSFIKNYNLLRSKGFYVFASYLMYPSLLKKYPEVYERFKKEGIILRPKIFWGDEYGIFKFVDHPFFHQFNHMKPVRNCLKRTYPQAFTKKQRDLVESYIEKSQIEDLKELRVKQSHHKRTIDLRLDKNWTRRLVSFKGKQCLAGMKFVKMDQFGNVARCNDEGHYQLGNMFNGEKLDLFDEPSICQAEICSCPYVGFRYALAEREG